MASKGTKITDRERKQIIADYVLDNSMHFLAKKYRRSTATIKKIVDEQKTEQPEQFANLVKRVKIINTNDILDFIRKDKRMLEITDKILNIMNDEKTLIKELDKKGLQPLTNAMGMMIDKALKLKSIEENVDALENGIKIKIVNDAPND